MGKGAPPTGGISKHDNGVITPFLDSSRLAVGGRDGAGSGKGADKSTSTAQ